MKIHYGLLFGFFYDTACPAGERIKYSWGREAEINVGTKKCVKCVFCNGRTERKFGGSVECSHPLLKKGSVLNKK